MKKILFAVILLLVFVPFVFAQQPETQDDYSSGEDLNSLYVSNINTTKDSFSTGNVVEGTFDLNNIGQYVVSGVKYRVELVQIVEDVSSYDYEDGLPPEEIESDQITNSIARSTASNPISVSPGVEIVNFSYQIPQTLPEGRIGVLIQLYTSEDIQGNSDYAEINVSGDRVSYIYANGIVNVEGERFSPLEGPSVYPNEKANLDLSVNNTTANAIKITPQIKVFSGNSSNGELVYSNDFPMISATAGETNYSYILKTDIEPGVYTGVLNLLDESGAQRVVPIEFRYIVDGIKPKIGEVYYNTTNLVNDDLQISLSYLDIPLNFRKNDDGTYKDERVQSFVDANGELDLNNLSEVVSSFITGSSNYFENNNISAVVRVKDFITGNTLATRNISFTQSSQSTIDVGRIIDTNQIMVEVDLYQGGEIIDTYTDIVPVETYRYKNAFDKIWNLYGNILITIIALVAMVIAIALLRKSKINNNVAISCIVAAVMVVSSVVVTDNAEAVSTSGFKQDHLISKVDVVNPKPPAVRVYEPGEVFKFNADFSFVYCTNSGYDLNARISRPVLKGKPDGKMGAWMKLGKHKFLGQVWDGAPHTHLKYDSGINVAIKAPNQPGVYTFKYDIVARSGEWGDYQPGRVNFRVAVDQCKNIPGVQASVPRGYTAATANGQPVCNQNSGPANISCSASKTRLEIGESVTYTARNPANTPADFSWYLGRSADPSELIQTDDGVVSSTYTDSYGEAGIYHTTAVMSVGGQSESCTMVVSVGDEFMDYPLDEYPFDDDYVDEYYTDEDGNKYLLDRNSPPGKIEFNMEGVLTNTTCKADWSAEYVLKCGMYKNNVKVKDIDFTGDEDLAPGTYQIKCIQKRDGKQILSDIRTCRLNPDVREF